MEKNEVQHLIQIAKRLKNKRDNNQITPFEEAELKEIYKLLIVDINKQEQ